MASVAQPRGFYALELERPAVIRLPAEAAERVVQGAGADRHWAAEARLSDQGGLDRWRSRAPGSEWPR
jgi:hypothetical protein